jgi:hypothetical protein
VISVVHTTVLMCMILAVEHAAARPVRLRRGGWREAGLQLRYSGEWSRPTVIVFGSGVAGTPDLPELASASVACTWATAAQTAAVACPSPCPRYFSAFAASSLGLALLVRHASG